MELGHRLFYEADLSLDSSMSCATCHEQRHAFADGNRTHPGVTDEEGVRNVPSLANVGAFQSLTWIDQHVTMLDRQVFIPLSGHHPVEMGMTDMSELVRRLSANGCYRALFSRGFPGSASISPENIAQAIAAFERLLVSNSSLWDKSGQSETPQQKKGRKVFFGRGKCETCHVPPLFMDQAFHSLSGKPEDRVRTPSLRNADVTAPYLHDGSAPTLNAAILAHPEAYALSEQDISSIAAFLTLLTDQDFLSRKNLALPAETCPVQIGSR